MYICISFIFSTDLAPICLETLQHHPVFGGSNADFAAVSMITPQITPRPQLPPLPKHSFWEVPTVAFSLIGFPPAMDIGRFKLSESWMTMKVGWLTFNPQTN